MRALDEDVVLAALEAGVTLLDTADVYAERQSERAVGRALARFSGRRESITVATKGGLVRDGELWRRDGRASHLVETCKASLEALGLARIDLYQLHAPDTRVAIETSARALAGLMKRGVVGALGMSNVSLGELERACSVAEIAAVQIELGPFCGDAVKSGVARGALSRGMLLLAYAPFGGPGGARRIRAEPVFARVAERHGVTPFEATLAYLADLHPRIVPLPGPSTKEHARSAANAASISLKGEDRDELDARFARLATLRPDRKLVQVSAERSAAEVVLLLGAPAAGKSTLVRELVEAGYERLNRDLTGGRLDGLARILDQRLGEGGTRFVLDNTYGTRKSRYAVLEVAAKRGAVARCIWLDTPQEEALRNAVVRMLDKFGRLLDPAEIRSASKNDPNTFGPNVVYSYDKSFEPPAMDEGFASIERRPFERRPAPKPEGPLRDGPDAVLFDVDAPANRRRLGADASADLRARALERLRVLASGGVRLWGFGWQPGRTQEEAQALDVDIVIDVRLCTHAAGPPVCWCRKPLPGLVLALCRTHGIAPERVLYLGASTLDATFARRLGMTYEEATRWWTGDTEGRP